jgi:hypothetical protein
MFQTAPYAASKDLFMEAAPWNGSSLLWYGTGPLEEDREYNVTLAAVNHEGTPGEHGRRHAAEAGTAEM